LARGKKEPIKYAPFEFQYFCYPLLDFTAYGEVLKRTGVYQCEARVFSVAAPSGEIGTIPSSMIEELLSHEEFEQARLRGWPTRS
jgi:hypothetical protein